MITARKFSKMLSMDADEVCMAINKLSEKDAKDFMKAYFLRQKYPVPLEKNWYRVRK